MQDEESNFEAASNDFVDRESKTSGDIQNTVLDYNAENIKVDDEAAFVLGRHLSHKDACEMDSRSIRRCKMKIDLWVTFPMFATMGVIQWGDTILSLVGIFGMIADLDMYTIGSDGLDLHRYNMVTTLYFTGAAVGVVPLVFLSQVYGVRRVIPLTLICYGIIQLCTAAAQSYQGVWIARFFLGIVAEPCISVFFLVTSCWYTQNEQVTRLGIWISSAGFATVLCSAVCIGASKINGALEPWRYMFILAGVIALSWALLTIFIMPGTPVKAWFLNEKEKFWAVDRLKINNQGIMNHHIKKKQILEAFKSPDFYILLIMIFCVNVVNGALNAFGALISSSFGYTPTKAAELIMPAGAVSMISALVMTILARIFPNSRTIFTALASLVPLAGSIMLRQINTTVHRAAGLAGFYMVASYTGAYVLICSFFITNVAGTTKRSLYAGASAVFGLSGCILGPYLFKENQSPSYESGYLACAICLAIIVLLAICLRIYWGRINTIRQRNYGVPKTDAAFSDQTDVINHDFRYKL